MNKLKYVLIALLVAVGCAVPAHKEAAVVAGDTSAIATTPPCGDYCSDYSSDVHFDTLLHGEGSTIRLFAFVDTTRKVKLPPELRPDCTAPFFYETSIKVCDVKDPGKAFIINRELVGFLIKSGNSYLPKYAVPLGVRVDSFNVKTHKMKISFSLSVPFTDIGKPIKMDLDPFRLLRDVSDNISGWGAFE